MKRKKRLAERAQVLRSIRSFFDARGFLEVETPSIVPSPGMDLHLDAFEVADAGWLVTSPEYQMKRLLCEGYERIYQLGRCYRRNEQGAQHNAEFTMLEWYRGHAGVEDVVRDTEQLVASVSGGRFVIDGGVIDARPPFARLTVCEAFERFARVSAIETLDMASNDEDRFYRLLVDHVEPALAQLPHAVFLTEYPTPMASLARKKPGDPRVAERFELYVAGVELCNGFGELTDPGEQRARFLADQDARRARGLPVHALDEKFLAALEHGEGMPPSGGNALGVDRLVALACGTREIEGVLAFTAEET